jgi:hypothetical protein
MNVIMSEQLTATDELRSFPRLHAGSVTELSEMILSSQNKLVELGLLHESWKLSNVTLVLEPRPMHPWEHSGLTGDLGADAKSYTALAGNARFVFEAEPRAFVLDQVFPWLHYSTDWSGDTPQGHTYEYRMATYLDDLPLFHRDLNRQC